MEVASTQNRPIIRENERIICYRAQLSLKDVGTILQSVAHGPKDLRRAAQCVRILYSCAIAMTIVNLTITHQLESSSGADLLPTLSPYLVNARIQRYMAAHQSFNTHGTGDLCRPYKRLRVSECQYRDGLHQVCSIDKCQPFFCMQAQWPQLNFLQCLGSAAAMTIMEGLALTDKYQREMCQWCQVAACAYRASRWNDRIDSTIEHAQQGLDNLDTRTGIAARKARC